MATSREYIFFIPLIFFIHGSQVPLKIPTDFTNAMKTGVDLNREDWSNTKSLELLICLQLFALEKVLKQSLTGLEKMELKNEVVLVSGSTDSNAAFYASGATRNGDWTSTIGTTLAIKGLSRNQTVG